MPSVLPTAKPILVKPKIQEPTQVIEPEQTPTQQDSGAIFQAVGVIRGNVKIGLDGNNTITIGCNSYPLYYLPHKFRVFEALKKEIETASKEAGCKVTMVSIFPVKTGKILHGKALKTSIYLLQYL